MHMVSEELFGHLPSASELVRVLVRLIAAMAVGALIGYQREQMGKAAGLRTHILLSMGTALLVVAALEYGMEGLAVSHVIEGLVTGMGFLGAGAIMKIQQEQEIRGLTTAAGIWMTAAAGITIGLGQIVVGLIAGALAWLVLEILGRIDPVRKAGPPHGNG